ncbi:MAG: M20/M25/M40 family metallo-hydrolase [Armatimonadetes bacterium]|nr:M20/M25/M40 family metallo-hydrolase [Armatimonadota bacterium]
MDERVRSYIREHLDDGMAELKLLCASRSVSAQGEGRETAALVAERLSMRGMETRIASTPGNPVVFGEAPGRSDATLLIYNHYDVQPAEPLELWDSPPFEATVRGGQVFARGADDNKGHIASRLLMLDAYRAVHGEYPCRIKWVIEGEEEIGSLHLADFVHANADLIAADGCVWETGGVDPYDHPYLYLGLRGILYVELRCKTGTLDAHSGIGGSIFPNAAWRLVWALYAIKGPDERIRISGFYDAAWPATETDLAMLETLPEEESYLKEQYGLDRFLLNATGLELKRRALFEPTATVCGLSSGYQGPGSKTVLPAEAVAKMDFRLVPDMHPDAVFDALRRHLDANGFDDIELAHLGGEPPARVDPNDPVAQLMTRTAEEVYGREAHVWPFLGGSGPMHPFVHELGIPVVANGVGWPGGRPHAPNENIRIKDFQLGTEHMARFVEQFPSVAGDR